MALFALTIRNVRRLERASAITILLVAFWGFSPNARAEILCADDTIPAGMAITATGTAASCAGACRARKTKPVCGPIMKICAGQPIPRGYILDSLTSMPGCECLGSEDNGYVIRYVGMRDQPSLSESDPTDDDVNPYVGSKTGSDENNAAHRAYGDPPFGNLLCQNTPINVPSTGSLPALPITGLSNSNPYAPQLPGIAGQTAPPPSWDYQQSEPFRLGQ